MEKIYKSKKVRTANPVGTSEKLATSQRTKEMQQQNCRIVGKHMYMYVCMHVNKYVYMYIWGACTYAKYGMEFYSTNQQENMCEDDIFACYCILLYCHFIA